MGEDLLDDLDAYVDEVRRTARQAEVLCSFADNRLVSREDAASELQTMSERLLARSQAISRLIDVFLHSPLTTDRYLVDWARDLVAESKSDLYGAYGRNVFTDVQDICIGRDTFH